MKRILTISIIMLGLLASGCFLKPRVPDMQQGNVIERPALNKLQPGMTKAKVRYILGDPVLVDVFNDNVWTYAYTKQINGGKITKEVATLYFENNKLVHVNGGPTPLKHKGAVRF